MKRIAAKGGKVVFDQSSGCIYRASRVILGFLFVLSLWESVRAIDFHSTAGGETVEPDICGNFCDAFLEKRGIGDLPALSRI